MKAAKSIESLPAELIEQVFVNLDAVTDVRSLAQSSRSLQQVFNSNPRSILFNAILPRSVLCYDEALYLLALQQGRQEVQIDDGKATTALAIAQQMYANARHAALACKVFEVDTHPIASSQSYFPFSHRPTESN